MTGRLIKHGDFMIRDDNRAQDWVIVEDIYHNDSYRTRFWPDRESPDEVVFDIGAHIGAFSKRWHVKNPLATIVCVEACPENLPALVANVGDFARIVHAACTYEPGRLALMNAVFPNCASTGGSIVVPLGELDDGAVGRPGYAYWHDRRELPKVTLEDLLRLAGVDHIDVLKLDCEGSEFSILGRTPSLERIHAVVGEYHGAERWNRLVAERFAGWDYGIMAGGELGIFHLVNRAKEALGVRRRAATAQLTADHANHETHETHEKKDGGQMRRTTGATADDADCRRFAAIIRVNL